MSTNPSITRIIFSIGYVMKIHGNHVTIHLFAFIFSLSPSLSLCLATNIEGDQETELLAEYEASQKQKQANERSGRNLKTSSIENNQEDHIKKRPFNNTNQVPSSNNINGFDRGYEPEKILGATDSAGELMLLVKWRHSDEADLVPARIANFKCPKLVIDFYEQHSFWTRLPKTNE